MLLIFLLYGLPEAFLLILVSLGLLGIAVRPGRLILTGLCLGVFSLLSRMFLYNIGLHTPVYLLGLAVALGVGFRLSVRTSIIGCFLSYFLLNMGEVLLVPPVLSAFRLPLSEVSQASFWVQFGLAWLSAAFLVIAALVSHVGRIHLIKAPEAQLTKEEG